MEKKRRLDSGLRPVSLPDSREVLRRQYEPTPVRLLFVGESPPASGRFFYQRDSGLYRAVRELFRRADSTINDENVLSRFQEAGCYLVDLCSRPVDDLDRLPRRAACVAGEPLLSETIRQLQPETIVSLMRSILGNVQSAAAVAGWRGPVIDVPYPARWVQHREIFIGLLLPRIEALLHGTGRS